MKSDSDEYPSYLIDATNEMFIGFGIEFLSDDRHEHRIFEGVPDSIHLYKISEAFKRLIHDRNFLNDLGKAEYSKQYIRYYYQYENEIKTIEEDILIRGGMHPEAARFILEEAMKSIWDQMHGFQIEPPEFHLSKIKGNMPITPRSLFYVIGGAAIIGLNAISSLNEPAVQISYALGGALIGKA